MSSFISAVSMTDLLFCRGKKTDLRQLLQNVHVCFLSAILLLDFGNDILNHPIVQDRLWRSEWLPACGPRMGKGTLACELAIMCAQRMGRRVMESENRHCCFSVRRVQCGCFSGQFGVSPAKRSRNAKTPSHKTRAHDADKRGEARLYPLMPLR